MRDGFAAAGVAASGIAIFPRIRARPGRQPVVSHFGGKEPPGQPIEGDSIFGEAVERARVFQRLFRAKFTRYAPAAGWAG
jgi:hypothetical protein